MKKIIAIVLTCMMLLSLCACSNRIKAEDMAGEWISSELDCSQFIIEELESTDDETFAELMPYLNFGPFNVVLCLTMTSPNSFTMTFEEETFNASFDTFMADLKDGIHDYVYALVIESIEQQGYTEEGYRELLGISADDDLLVAMGIDEAVMYDAIDDSMADMYDMINDEASQSGTYEVKDNMLTLIYGDGSIETSSIDKVGNTYTISGEDTGDSMMSGIGNITFTKVEG